MKEKIINAAGKVWNLLGEKGAVALSQIPALLKEKDEIVYQAVGWLAREDKIAYTRKGVRMYIALVASEQTAWRFVKETALV